MANIPKVPGKDAPAGPGNSGPSRTSGVANFSLPEGLPTVGPGPSPQAAADLEAFKIRWAIHTAPAAEPMDIVSVPVDTANRDCVRHFLVERAGLPEGAEIRTRAQIEINNMCRRVLERFLWNPGAPTTPAMIGQMSSLIADEKTRRLVPASDLRRWDAAITQARKVVDHQAQVVAAQERLFGNAPVPAGERDALVIERDRHLTAFDAAYEACRREVVSGQYTTMAPISEPPTGGGDGGPVMN